ncbi:threonine ammonia-lyase [Rhizomonospora bruguierae]|uniref:threonine ammonia-lyase n=1 Tax=Rhizomonospora bruguierae TaxID=1581705 RepID=UPI001BCC7CD3|nr:threonine/serine dehydratase [Micromonospora sp. NBRC 107566]
MELISLDDIRAAAKSIAGVAVRTPLLPCPWAEGLQVKPENLQPIGAFKQRGAYHAVSRLDADRRARGVIAHSSGNHAQALAYAARDFGVPCVVVMPDVTTAVKVDACRALGAEVVLVPPVERVSAAERLAGERGLTMIPPFDHPNVIAGQGTIGLEIVEDQPDVDLVLVPVSGGGLASGVATAVKALKPSATVIGVEPEYAADACESLEAGELRPWPVERTYRTVADGLRAQLSELTLAHLQAHLDRIVTVTDEEILDAIGLLARNARLVVEPSGAVAVAAYLRHRAELPAGRAVAVLTGGNIDPALLAGVLVP